LTIGSYNGFSILIRDIDGSINTRKLVNDINEKDSITKNLKNIIKGPEFQTLEKQMISEEVLLKKNATLHYILPNVFSNDLRGVYIHKGLLILICIQTSIKYLIIVSEILDNINLQAHLLEVDGNDHLQDTLARIKKGNEDLKSNVNNLNKVIIDDEKRMVPKNIKNIIT
jgi:hypothetical protein